MGYKESLYNVVIATDKDGRKLVSNTSTMAIAWIDGDKYAKIRSNHIEADELMEQMAKYGFVVRENFDEFENICRSRIRKMKNHNPRKLQYVIAPSLECNMNCRYCFERPIIKKETMSSEDIEVLIEFLISQIEQSENCKMVRISWFGGEPTLHIDKIIQIARPLISYCDNKGITISTNIVTNGLLFNKHIVEILSKEANLTRAQISLDGMKKSHATQKGVDEDTFYKVINNIIDNHSVIKETIRVNVYPGNEDDVIELFKYILHEKGLDKKVRMYAAPLFMCNGVKEQALYNERTFVEFCERISEVLDKKNLSYDLYQKSPRRADVFCNAQKEGNISIGPDLLLYRCEHCIGQKQYAIGSVQDGIDKRNKFDKIFMNYNIENRCRVCKYLPVCQGGCRMNSEFENIAIDCDFMPEKYLYQVKNLITEKGLNHGNNI